MSIWFLDTGVLFSRKYLLGICPAKLIRKFSASTTTDIDTTTAGTLLHAHLRSPHDVDTVHGNEGTSVSSQQYYINEHDGRENIYVPPIGSSRCGRMYERY